MHLRLTSIFLMHVLGPVLKLRAPLRSLGQGRLPQPFHNANAILAILAGMLWVSPLCAEDWRQWGGDDGRNMVSNEKAIPGFFAPGQKRPDGSGIDLATTQNVKWIASVASQMYGNPTVANGRVFVGANDSNLHDSRFDVTGGGSVRCYSEASGKLLWQLIVPRHYTLDPSFNFDELNLGVCTSPTVDGDRVYVVTNRCDILCLDAKGMSDGNDGSFQDEAQYFAGPGRKPVATGPQDADILWRFDMIRQVPCWPQDAACSSPLVVGDFLYVGTSNGVDKSSERIPFPKSPSLIVLDKHTGQMVAWENAGISARVLHGQWSSPSCGVVNGKKLVFFGAGDGFCYAFEALEKKPEKPGPLKLVWRFDCNPNRYRFHDGQPIRYMTGDVRRNLGNKNDGTFVGPSEIIATPVFHNQRVYVAIGQDPLHGRGRGMLSCIDATKTGDISTSGKIWTYDKLDRTLSNATIHKGLVYISDVVGTLHCLDADTGYCHWTHPTKAEVWGSPFVVDGKVYLGNEKALWVFAEGKEKKVLGKIRLGTPVHCTPIAANGVLFVASQRYLWAVQDLGAMEVQHKPQDTRDPPARLIGHD
jgi:outer membrane protein assembly factor BamB